MLDDLVRRRRGPGPSTTKALGRSPIFRYLKIPQVAILIEADIGGCICNTSTLQGGIAERCNRTRRFSPGSTRAGLQRGKSGVEKNRLGLIRRNDGVVLEWGRDYDVPMNNTSIAGVRIPDSKLAQAATELVRDTESRCIPPVGINV